MRKAPVSRQDILIAAAIAVVGSALGLVVNVVSPKGFNFMIASGLQPAAMPSTDWDDEPTPSGQAPVLPGPKARP